MVGRMSRGMPGGATGLFPSYACDGMERCSSRTSWADLSGLREGRECSTLSYMKNATVTIRLDAKLQRDLDRLSRQLGRSRSELVRDAVRRQVALLQFEQIRHELVPLAEAQGILTDEDVFKIVS